jgi:hypothetical protein
MAMAQTNTAPVTGPREDVPPLAPILERLVQRPAAHARFLNTLSLLEHIGVRKILKSQRSETYDADLLAHVVEEARHAYLIKMLAQRVGDGAVPGYTEPELLCGGAARLYLQTLDHAAERDLHDGGPRDGGARVVLNYLLTTLLVEERADLVYPVHEPILARLGFGGVLASIIREEAGHQKIAAARLARLDPRGGPRLDRLRALERRAFAAFVAALDREAGA